jgi:hypothetical protein
MRNIFIKVYVFFESWLKKEWVKVLFAGSILAVSIGFALLPLFEGKVIFEEDVIYYYLPAFKFYSDALRQGSSFLIAPIFSGFPLPLTQVGGFFDPLNLLIFKLFPFLDAYHIRIALNYFLGGFFTFLFARSLKLSFIASLLAMFAFVTAQHIVPGANILRSNSFFLMPGLFWTIHQLSLCVPQRRIYATASYIATGAMILAVSFLGGYTQLNLYGFIAVLFFAGYLLYRNFSLRFLFSLAALFSLAGMLLLPYISAVLDFVQVTHRLGGLSWAEAAQSITPGSYLRTLTRDLFLPPFGTNTLQSLYIGSVSVLFFCYGLTLSKRNSLVAFFAGLLAFSILSAFPFPLFFAMHFLPVFSYFRFPPHWFFVGSFALSMLAALGMHYIYTAKVPHAFISTNMQQFLRTRVTILGLLIILVLNFIIPVRLEISQTSISSENSLAKPWVVRTIDKMHTTEAFRTYQLYPSDISWFLFKKSFSPDSSESDKFEREYTQAHLLPLIWGIDSVRGFDNLEPVRYRKVLASLESSILDVVEDKSTSVFDATIVLPPRVFSLLGMMNVKYIWSAVALSKKNLQNDVTYVDASQFETRPILIRLYQNNYFLPRVFAPSSIVAVPEGEQNFSTIITAPHDFSKVGFIECADCAAGTSAQEGVVVKDTVVNNDRVSFTTESPVQAWVVVSNSMIPGWEATIDGISTKIHYANYIYQGILIPVGTHKVVIRYIPPYKNLLSL